jgi:uncharacterized repeat protein (TIGR03803 family)
MKKQLLLSLSCLLLLLTTNAQERLIGSNAYGIDPLSKGVVYTVNTDGTNYAAKHDFIQSWGIGVDVVDGQDGFLYGIAAGNGTSSSSAVFKMRYDGTQYRTLHVFINSTEGYKPRYRPALHPNGYIYGVCELGGTNNNGTIWKMQRDGSDFSVIKHFNQTAEGVNGAYGSVTAGADGKLYGLAAGGANGNGAIFKINAVAPYTFTFLSFTSATTGKDPRATLYQASDGRFYGVCNAGGTNGIGTIFKLTPGTGTTVGTLANAWNFSAADGANPQTTLVEGGNGYLYGGCSTGGANSKGIIFQFDKATSTLTEKVDLTVATGGSLGRQLYFGTDDSIYGFTTTGGTSGAGTFFTVNGAGLVVLKDGFGGGTNVNSFTYDPVSRMLYGVAANGGLRSAGLSFKIKMDGTGFQLCHQFLYHWMGSALTGKLAYIQQANALFNRVYGICYTEGLYERGSLYTLFPDIANSFRVVKQFTVANGLNPSAVIVGTDQKLYGTFKSEGTDGSTSYSGSVFSINPANNDTFSFVKGFTASTTGLLQPIGDLLEASNGYLYGTASSGGASNLGGVFKVKKDGTDYQTIRQFVTADGSGPVGGLTQDAATGLIYGVTQAGGSTGGGTMFTINPSAGDNFQVIYQVPASLYFNGGLLIINDSIYGTSAGGGTSTVGTLFRMKKDGSTAHTVLKNFNSTDGGGPHGYLAKSTDGYIYGACGYGAENSGGSLYKVYPDGSNFSAFKKFPGSEGQLPRPVTLAACNAAPYPNASNIVFGRIATNSITINGWTAPTSNVNGYVVKINTNATFTNMVNGANPTASTVYAGGEQVIYNGTGINPITVTNLQPGTVYYFKVFAYGGCSGRSYANDDQTGNPAAQGTTPTGVVSNANLMAVLDGVDDYVNLGDANTIEGQSAISFGGWVKPMSFPAVDGNVRSIVSKGDESTGSGSMLSVRIYKSDGVVKVDASLGINNTQQTVSVNLDVTTLNLNEWSHVFVTWQSGDKMRFYINGRKVAESAPITGLTNNVTTPLRFGYASTGYSNAQKLFGNLEEWQFYNVSLSDCELRQRKHIILTGAEPGLRLYYQFNEAGSTAFNDFVGSTTGTKVNGATAILSDLSAGPGGSACVEISSPEYTYDFNSTDLSNRLQLRFPGRGPLGFLNGSYLEAIPVGGNPNPGSNMLPGYWIIDNYGQNTNNLQTNVTFRLPDGILTDADMSHYTLYKRASNGSGSWTAYPINGISLDAGNNSININNIPSFSQLVITSTVSALPLQLLSFDGSLINGDASLKWETINELNVDHFELERKLPGEGGFSKATNLLAKNSSSNVYSFIDKRLPIGITWYRLKVVDKDGRASYSQIITVSNKSNTVTVFPNPAKDFIHIVNAGTKSTASLLTVDGRIMQSNINLVQNLNTINIQQLVPGIYILKIETNSGTEMHRFIKQ